MSMCAQSVKVIRRVQGPLCFFSIFFLLTSSRVLHDLPDIMVT